MANPTSTGPCEPVLARPHPIIHRYRATHILGRVRRHGTGRVARHLPAPRDGCLPGTPVAVLKLTAPAAGLVAADAGAAGLHYATAGSRDTDAGPGDPGLGMLGGGPGGLSGGTVTVGKPGHHHVVAVAEPPSGGLLLGGLILCAFLRIRRRPNFVRRS